jgi:hypothetical protein
MDKKYKVNESKNWKRMSNGDVFTGKQINNLLELSNPIMQAMILMDIMETDEIPEDSKSKYGLAEKGSKGV